jgi:hypothetical protein
MREFMGGRPQFDAHKERFGSHVQLCVPKDMPCGPKVRADTKPSPFAGGTSANGLGHETEQGSRAESPRRSHEPVAGESARTYGPPPWGGDE